VAFRDRRHTPHPGIMPVVVLTGVAELSEKTDMQVIATITPILE
jgi:hypothetical protein